MKSERIFLKMAGRFTTHWFLRYWFWILKARWTPPPPPTCWCMQHLQRACQGWVGILNKFSGTRKLADHWPAGFNVEPLPYRSCDHLLPIMPPYQQPQHTISLQHKSRFGLSCHLWQAPGPFWNDYKIITFLVSLSLWATLIQNRVFGARCHRK